MVISVHPKFKAAISGLGVKMLIQIIDHLISNTAVRYPFIILSNGFNFVSTHWAGAATSNAY